MLAAHRAVTANLSVFIMQQLIARLTKSSNKKCLYQKRTAKDNGTPYRIRTCDLRIRNPVLYPAELRERIIKKCHPRSGGRGSGSLLLLLSMNGKLKLGFISNVIFIKLTALFTESVASDSH